MKNKINTLPCFRRGGAGSLAVLASSLLKYHGKSESAAADENASAIGWGLFFVNRVYPTKED
jgi:hypothetical protein